MQFQNNLLLTKVLIFILFCSFISPGKSQSHSEFKNASSFGFLPDRSGVENTIALQKAVEGGGTIIVSKPGVYLMADTVFLESNTSLQFGNGVFLQKTKENGGFTHVFLNKGALSKSYDENISISGLHIRVNGVDKTFRDVYGLRGHLAFFYAKDIRIDRFRLLDLEAGQYAIHVCAFEDLIIDDVIIKGRKDGIHLGRGKRFSISRGVFQTVDDAIALNGHDYATSNPELGWIEDGIISQCHDLNQDKIVGFFCRILAGAWTDWKKGMEVQLSDTVVSNGRVYRVQAHPRGRYHISNTQPTHAERSQKIDGITWGVVQEGVQYSAGVRNVIFRDIYLSKPRTGFSIHFDNSNYSRSYYPGAPIVIQRHLQFDNIRVKHQKSSDLFSVGTPLDVLTVSKTYFGNTRIKFKGPKDLDDFEPTHVNLVGCIFNKDEEHKLLYNSVPGKQIFLKTSASVVLKSQFKALVDEGSGNIHVDSDLPGLSPN